jgi:hypothetical protein
MQVMFNGQERTLREIVALARSAGWMVVKVTKAQGSLFGHIVAVPVDVDVHREEEVVVEAVEKEKEEKADGSAETVSPSSVRQTRDEETGKDECLVVEPEVDIGEDAVVVGSTKSSLSLRDGIVHFADVLEYAPTSTSTTSVDLPSVAGSSTKGGTIGGGGNDNSNGTGIGDGDTVWGSYWKEDTAPSLELHTQLPSERDGRKNPIFNNDSEVSVKMVTATGAPTEKKARRGAFFFLPSFLPVRKNKMLIHGCLQVSCDHYRSPARQVSTTTSRIERVNCIVWGSYYLLEEGGRLLACRA